MKSFILLTITLTSLSTFAKNIQVAKGQSSYFYTHSRILNILSPKSSELEAYREAIYSISDICGGELFKLQGDVKFHHRFDVRSPEVNILAEQKFSCIVH